MAQLFHYNVHENVASLELLLEIHGSHLPPPDLTPGSKNPKWSSVPPNILFSLGCEELLPHIFFHPCFVLDPVIFLVLRVTSNHSQFWKSPPLGPNPGWQRHGKNVLHTLEGMRSWFDLKKKYVEGLRAMERSVALEQPHREARGPHDAISTSDR